jgi:hypothetical protein
MWLPCDWLIPREPSEIFVVKAILYRSQWLRSVRHEDRSPAETLRWFVRNSLDAWMSVCLSSMLKLSCVGLIPCPRSPTDCMGIIPSHSSRLIPMGSRQWIECKRRRRLNVKLEHTLRPSPSRDGEISDNRSNRGTNSTLQYEMLLTFRFLPLYFVPEMRF